MRGPKRDHREGSTGKGSGCKREFAETANKAWIDRASHLSGPYAPTPREQAVTASLIRQSPVLSTPSVHELISAVKPIGAKRVVLDSLGGFEMALAPEFRHEFRESLYRMIAALTRLGVTVLNTVEIEENFTSMGLSNFATSSYPRGTASRRSAAG